MLAPLLLLVLAALAWKFGAPGARFLPGFARLLTSAAIVRGRLSVLSGCAEASGSYQGREVVATLQQKRGTHGIGSFNVALRTASRATLDGAGLDSRVRDEAGRRALYALAMQDLMLTLDQGWLKALWRPQGLTFFPGAFVEDRWRQVLDAMLVVAASLEQP